ncbi:MAG: carboxypeptidase regulatory-like domain-containing protein, partial [Thermoanaerobaculia bacterium]
MHHHRRLALVSGLLALATVLPAWAQSWRGSEAIGIQANDSKGKPIAGARVVVSFQGRGSEGNPPEVATDQKGRAVVAGLATGPWQVEVQHPEFLTYVAVFDLQQGKKPSINASFLEAGGRSLTPMKVKLSKGNPRDASPPLPAREARSQAPAPSEPDRATVESAPTPSPVEATRAPDATITEEPSRQEEAKLEPQPEPVEATRAPEAAIAEESSQREEAKPEPEPEVEVQVAEEPLTPSPAESAPPIEESALPEVQET